MDIKFPQQENPFPKTIAKAVAACIAALLVGLFLGYGIGAMFGNDQAMVNTTNYTDNMYAVKNIFMDADQLDSYMVTAEKFRSMDGLKLYSNKNLDGMLCWYDGQYIDAQELFDEEIMLSLKELMNTQEALYGITDSAEDPIENVQVWNIAVEDGVVYYYLYYDAYGYIGIAYDDTETVVESGSETVMALVQNSEEEQGMWYLLYYVED